MFTPKYRRMMYAFLTTAVVSLILALAGCQQQPAPQAPQPPDTRAADETAIRTAEAGILKGFADLNAAAVVSFYTDDIVVMAVDSTLIQGKGNMQKYLEAMMKEKPEITFAAVAVEVARSGDLGYSWGKGTTVIKDKKGKATETTVKYLSVWKKQPDGGWKLAVGSVTPDPPEKNK